MVEIDIRDAVRKLNAEFGYVSNDKRRLAIARAINHTIEKGNTAAAREIRKEYPNILQAYVKKAFSLKKADRLTLTGKIRATGRPIPLIGFRARYYGSVKHNKSKFASTPEGVEIKAKSGYKRIPGVFIATMRNGKKGVFVRGKYSGGKIARHNTRLPITQMVGMSVPTTLTNKVILSSLTKSMGEMFPQRFKHELTRVAMPL